MAEGGRINGFDIKGKVKDKESLQHELLNIRVTGLNMDKDIKTQSILQDYKVEWNQKLGTGISGPVRPCKLLKTGERFALKCLPDTQKARTEASLHVMCSGHDNVVSVVDIYANDIQFPRDKQSSPYLLMVLEMMEGGELFDRISKEKKFTEKKAAKYFKKIALAVNHCHNLNVAHRDLKPENILLTDNSEEAELKLSDFGFAKIDDGNLQTPYFTPYYVAPQVLEAHRHHHSLRKGLIPTSKPYTYDKYKSFGNTVGKGEIAFNSLPNNKFWDETKVKAFADNKFKIAKIVISVFKSCDMWSLGVILYIMLCGYPPFYSETPSRQITMEMRRKILSGEFEFPEHEWSCVSEDAKNVVRSLLHVDPSYRLNIEELMVMPWLENAPDNQLSSPAVISDKQSLEDINLAHSQQLTIMRTPDSALVLKPLIQSHNPILRKRKYGHSSSEVLESQGSSKKVASKMVVKSLRDIIAYCILPPKVDHDESALIDLVKKSLVLQPMQNGFYNILKAWNWDGERFQEKVDKNKFAQLVSEMVQDLNQDKMRENSNDCAENEVDGLSQNSS